MIVTQTKEGFIYTRQSLLEWIMIRCAGELLFSLPKTYYPIHIKKSTDIYHCFHWSVYYIVSFFLWLNHKWWSLGRFLNRLGLLKTKEGEKKAWFWPIYFFHRQGAKIWDHSAFQTLKVKFNSLLARF